MPIHRERYRRRESGIDLRGGAWAVIAANGLRVARAEARVSLPDDPRVDSRDRPRRADLGGRECARHVADGHARRLAADVPRLPQPAGAARLLHHRLCGLGADCRRHPRECAAAVSLAAHHAHAVHRREGRDSHGRAGGGHVRAGHAAASARAGVCRQHDVPRATTCCSFRRSRRTP